MFVELNLIANSVSFSNAVFLHLFFLRFYLFLKSWERGGEREGEKYQCMVASCKPPTGDLARNPDLCPDWESNWQPFSLQARTQSTDLHQPRLFIFSNSYLLLLVKQLRVIIDF